MRHSHKLFAAVDAASLAVFRIGFGVIMMWEVYRYFSNGWIESHYITPEFHFKYYGFEWVQAWPGDGMYLHFALLGLLAFLVCIGFLYRWAIVAFTLAFTYVFLLDQAWYLNHFYFVILLSTILCFVPAQRIWSVDALRKATELQGTPKWSVWLLRAQMEIMLLYAGLVKLNADWLSLEPLAHWLPARSDFPLIGHLFHEHWVVVTAAYGVIALHLIGAPLLLFRQTRLVVFLLYAVFHVMNHRLFNIGIFPWITLFGTLIFFDPDWPRQVYARARMILKRRYEGIRAAAARSVSDALPNKRHRVLVLTFVGIWIAVQVILPLRHYLYPGDVAWTGEGHRFAWRMKLHTKRGESRFEVRDPATERVWLVEPRQHLSGRQYRYMSSRPDMILQFAHYLERRWRDGYRIPGVEVNARVNSSLNYRDPAPLIDPSRDLTEVTRSLRPADWILPLSDPDPMLGSNR
ncbi:MAG: HTTM domain-containing protein [Woeseiaceae bacterium]